MGVDVRTMGRSVTSLESRVAELERNGAEGGGTELDPNVYVTTSTFNSNLNAIRGSIAGLNNRVDGLNTLYVSCETIQSNQTDIQGQVNSIGARVSGIESLNIGSRTTTLESEVRTIKADVATLKANTGSSSSSGET